MRFEQWSRRLNATIQEYGRVAHEWGRTDCIMFAAKCVWCLTQKYPGGRFRETYNDEAGALRIIAECGGLVPMIEAAFAEVGIEAERIEPNFAQRGDPCLLDDDRSVGICMGDTIIGQTLTGLQSVPLARAKICWAIR